MQYRQNAPFLPDFDEYCSELKKAWSNKWLTNNGELHDDFLHLLHQRGYQNSVLTTNGHVALELVFELLEIKGEVITTPFTFASTVNAIVRRGCKPIFADIDADSFNISTDSVLKKITPETKAILAVHVFGEPCNLHELQQIAKNHNLILVYDAAHAFEVSVDGVNISQFGDASIFSFHATKLFHTFEGGLACFRDKSLAIKARQLINFGISTENTPICGTNSKMHEGSAAMGVVNLRHLPEIISRRRHLYDLYLSNFQSRPELNFQSNSFPGQVSRTRPYFPVLVKNRDTVVDVMAKKGVELRKYFHPLCSDLPYIQEQNQLPNATKVSKSIVTIPLHNHLSDTDCNEISNRFLDCLK